VVRALQDERRVCLGRKERRKQKDGTKGIDKHLYTTNTERTHSLSYHVRMDSIIGATYWGTGHDAHKSANKVYHAWTIALAQEELEHLETDGWIYENKYVARDIK